MNDDRQKWLKRAFWITWFILFFATGVVVWALVTSSKGTEVNNYISKTPGLSAYEVAVKYGGFKGNEIAWLESLKGDSIKGRDGNNSVSHDTVEKTIVKETVVKEKAIPGEKGDTGDKGEKGDTGENGVTPQLAQDPVTGQLYTKLPQDDDWKVIPKLCLGVLCGGGQ